MPFNGITISFKQLCPPVSYCDHGNKHHNFEKGSQLTWTTTFCVMNFKFVCSFLIFNKLTKHSGLKVAQSC